MNNIPLPAEQAQNSPARQDFPQPIPSAVLALPLSAAIEATLHFFDSGAITGDTAESWLSLLESMRS